MNGVPAARQSRDPARPEAGESLLFRHEKSSRKAALPSRAKDVAFGNDERYTHDVCFAR